MSSDFEFNTRLPGRSYAASPPMLRLQVDRMVDSITTLLDDQHDDLKACVKAGVEAAVADLPRRIAARAKELSESIVEMALEKALTEFWNNGGGRAQLDALIAKKFK
jgi:hypothetical protein